MSIYSNEHKEFLKKKKKRKVSYNTISIFNTYNIYCNMANTC